MSRNVNVVIMGKTGVGKSTLVNAVFKRNLARTGVGAPITLKNEKYANRIYYRNQPIDLVLYDTVGLEIDSEKNHSTLLGIQSQISNQMYGNIEDINIIWYCINSNSNRFEQYEDDLLQQLRYEYEIPYIIVLTQSWSRRSAENLANKLLSWNPNLIIVPILAEDYETDIGCKSAFGIDDLLSKSIYDYNDMKSDVLGEKIQILESQEEKYTQARSRSFRIVDRYADKAFKWGCVPLASLFSLQIIYGKMVSEIAAAYGVSLSSDDKTTIGALWAAVVVLSPFFAIPGFSGAIAKSLIEDEGQEFIDATERVVRSINGTEDNQAILERIKNELQNRKG